MHPIDLKTAWLEIRKHFNRSFTSGFHVSIASINSENQAVATPIGSLFLNADQTGFYFEKYPSTLPENVERHPAISVLAVNSGVGFWIRSLFKNRFDSYPAIRLRGELGNSRAATDTELARLKRRMRATRFLQGNQTLWGDMSQVREITFSSAEVANLGSMTKSLHP